MSYSVSQLGSQGLLRLLVGISINDTWSLRSPAAPTCTRSDSFSLLLCSACKWLMFTSFCFFRLSCVVQPVLGAQTDLERPTVRFQRDFPAGYTLTFPSSGLECECIAEKLGTPPISISLLYFLPFIAWCASPDLFYPDFIDGKIRIGSLAWDQQSI